MTDEYEIRWFCKRGNQIELRPDNEKGYTAIEVNGNTHIVGVIVISIRRHRR